MSVINSAVNWLINLANDNSHGYDQINRWGPDYDCSSSTIQAFEQAGLKVKEAGATNTWTMRKAFEKCGFKSFRYSKEMKLIKGDVLLHEDRHVVVVIDDGKNVVTASINEKGTAKGGKFGDQTGREIYVRNFYTPSYGWQYVLRYEESVNGNPYPVPTRTIAKGMSGDDCRFVQYELNEAGANLQIDGQIGSKSDEAIRAFQKAVGIQIDGRVGPATRQKLIENTTKVIGVANTVSNPYPIPTRVLRLNCKGEDVKFVQFSLNQKINAGLQIDGSYGKLTRQKVIEFQKRVFPNQPNEYDGVVGQKTLAKLKE